jgi:predicted MFS family arabinose efflux permease
VGERRLIPAAIAAIAAGVALMPLAHSVPVLLIACATLAAGMGFNSPSLSSMTSRLTHADDQGGVLGLAQSLASLGRIVGPAWGGFFFDRFGPTTPYFSSAALLAMACVAAVVGLSRSQ